jgi:hypothetical protein
MLDELTREALTATEAAHDFEMLRPPGAMP